MHSQRGLLPTSSARWRCRRGRQWRPGGGRSRYRTCRHCLMSGASAPSLSGLASLGRAVPPPTAVYGGCALTRKAAAHAGEALAAWRPPRQPLPLLLCRQTQRGLGLISLKAAWPPKASLALFAPARPAVTQVAAAPGALPADAWCQHHRRLAPGAGSRFPGIRWVLAARGLGPGLPRCATGPCQSGCLRQRRRDSVGRRRPRPCPPTPSARAAGSGAGLASRPSRPRTSLASRTCIAANMLVSTRSTPRPLAAATSGSDLERAVLFAYAERPGTKTEAWPGIRAMQS